MIWGPLTLSELGVHSVEPHHNIFHNLLPPCCLEFFTPGTAVAASHAVTMCFPEEGSRLIPGTSSSRQALAPRNRTVRGSSEAEEERPSHNREQPQQTLGTHQTKGQASHSHTMWRSSPRAMKGAKPPTASFYRQDMACEPSSPTQHNQTAEEWLPKEECVSHLKKRNFNTSSSWKSQKSLNAGPRIRPIPILFPGILLNGCTYIISNSLPKILHHKVKAPLSPAYNRDWRLERLGDSSKEYSHDIVEKG